MKVFKLDDRDKLINLYKKFQETQNRKYLEEIQHAVDKKGKTLVFFIDNPKMKIKFEPQKLDKKNQSSIIKKR